MHRYLVIADPVTGDTIVAEFPDAPACTPGADSTPAALMQQARAAFVATFGMPSADRFTPLSGNVQISGVGLFDVLHSEEGVAPNGIELHPVLSFPTTAGSGPSPGAPLLGPASLQNAAPLPSPAALPSPAPLPSAPAFRPVAPFQPVPPFQPVHIP